jgi:hypothetical protein
MKQIANDRATPSTKEVNMRGILALLIGATLASCSTAPPQPVTRSAQGQRDFERLTAGKVAGPAIACIPSYAINDQTIIDGRTIAFRSGGGATVYIAHLSEGCELAGRGTYALVSRKFGSADTCRGDIEQVVDTVNHINVGSCVVGDITPYTTPR